MRILIADDNPMVRRGIAALLSSDAECEVCGEAADSPETLSKAGNLRPDLILLDVSMPGASGLETARLLRRQLPSVKILILSQHDPDQLRGPSLEAGAQGCVDKSRVGTDLLFAIKSMFAA